MKEKGNEKDIEEWRYLHGPNGRFDETILIEATSFGRLNILRWLLHELKFDVNEQNKNGDIALHVAVSHNQMDCARLLLDVGSQHLKNRWGNTPLDYAKKNGHKEMKSLIVTHFHLR